jgi:hypothetical protein
MRKLLVRTFSTLISFIAAYFIIIVLVSLTVGVNWIPNVKNTTGAYGEMLIRSREAKKVNQIDLLFLGSSHTYKGFDPRIFDAKGISTFNLGSSSQTPLNSYYLLKSYLPTIKPKYVVLDLYWTVLGLDGIEAAVDIISNTEIDKNMLDMTVSTQNIVVYNSIIYSKLAQYFDPLSEVVQAGSKDEYYIPGGYTQTLLTQNILGKDELQNIRNYTITLNDKQLEYIRKIVELCRANNIKVIFVIAPVTAEYFNKALNYGYYISKINNIANDYKIVVFDYNKRADLNLNSMEDFCDKDHLTQKGVVKFNTLFIDDLHKYNLISAHK